ncbi:MAG: PA0069 family radical SAM protein [Ignavibacteria bacterium]|nr:PA0069 family radical SAM protein [Ignavibacteria bacterium]
MIHRSLKSRGTSLNPKNRFEPLFIDYEDLADEYFEEPPDRKLKTNFFRDNSRTILSENNSPDLGFRYSINPYRGCEHGCIYCYARPSHEYLGFSSGLEFETKIMVKPDAAELLEKHFMKKSWKPEFIMFSGNTDCYQPVERKLQLTRKCLEVFLKFRNPVGLITKNALIQRDIDLIKKLAELNLVSVVISITTLNRELSRKLEPRTSVPKKRLETIYKLSSEGIPTGVNVAPIIPGLNDEEIPQILKAASENGAKFAGHIILRLPYSVKELFIEWLERNFPERAKKIINRIHEVRGKDKLSDNRFGTRMSGEGIYAEAIHQLFRKSCIKYGLNRETIKLRTDLFTRKTEPLQTELF